MPEFSGTLHGLTTFGRVSPFRTTSSMPSGVLMALCAYALFSCCDATIKSFGGQLSVFEIGFYTTLFSLVPALLSKPREHSWRQCCHLEHPWLVQVRALAGLLGSACVIYAFTHIPLAQVYSIGFLAPLFLGCLSAVLLKEAVSSYRWLLVVIGFIGVLIVVRPGMIAISLGHLAALGGAIFCAISTTALRKVSGHENRLSIFAVVTAYSLSANGVMMVLQGAPVPTPEQFLKLAFVGTLGGIGHLTFIGATKHAAANHIAPTQYSQLGWAILFGAVFYREFPDQIALIGLAIVLAAGLLNVVPPERCVAVISRFGVALKPKGRTACEPPIEPVATAEM